MKANCPITVESLRRQGYRVRVIHRRNYPFVEMQTEDGYSFVPYLSDKEAEPFEAMGYNMQMELSSFGGSTRVEVTTPDNRELVGEAVCNVKDQFNRQLALRIALGRALKPQRCSE